MQKISMVIALGALVLVACGKVIGPRDRTPPATPSNFTLLGGGDGQARLRWDANQEPDFKHYAVYRTTDVNQPFESIAQLTANEFVDQFLSYDTTYYYRITAIDYAGNESDPTDYIDVLPINISSPSRPQSLQVHGHNQPVLRDVAMYLNWKPNEEGDLRRYYVYRSTTEDFAPSDSTLMDSTQIASYRDTHAQIGVRYHYRVQAVDNGGKRSIPSTPANDLILEQVRLISPGNGVTVTGPFELRWQQVPEAKAYRVFVTKSPLTQEVWRSELLSENITKIGYLGSPLQSGRSYYWWVAAYSYGETMDESGHPIEPELNSQSDYARFVVRN